MLSEFSSTEIFLQILYLFRNSSLWVYSFRSISPRNAGLKTAEKNCSESGLAPKRDVEVHDTSRTQTPILQADFLDSLFFPSRAPSAELLGLCVHPDISKCFLNLAVWQHLASLQDKASS